MRAIITGGTGFVGAYLCRHLLEWGDTVAVLSICHDGLPSDVAFFQADIREAAAVQRVFSHFAPDAVYHLAAISSVAASRQNLRLLQEVNVGGTYNVFEAASHLPSLPRILNVSTAQVYRGGQDCLDEESLVAPTNPYACTKAMAELIGPQFVEAYGTEFITARAFNHSGPGQSADFVLSSFARQVAEIEAGLKPPMLLVGDLDVERDFLDVRDVVRAYGLLLRHGRRSEVYNVASGQPRSIRQILNVFARLCRVPFGIQVDPERVRSHQPNRICGRIGKITADTGWRPSIPLDDTLTDLLDYWRHLARDSARSIPL